MLSFINFFCALVVVVGILSNHLDGVTFWICIWLAAHFINYVYGRWIWRLFDRSPRLIPKTVPPSATPVPAQPSAPSIYHFERDYDAYAAAKRKSAADK